MALAIFLSADLVADCRESGEYFVSTCLDQFCWEVVDSSLLPFFSVIVLQPPILCEG